MTDVIDSGLRDRRMSDLYAKDRQFREARPDERVTKLLERQPTTTIQLLAVAMEGYASRPALGDRATETITDPATGRTTVRLLPHFTTITYRELWARVNAVAAEFHHDPHSPVRVGDVVATIGFASSDYTVVDLGCVRAGAVSVPLQAGAALSVLSPIIAETAPRVLAASLEHLDTALDLAIDSGCVQRLVVFDCHFEADDQRETVEAARTRLAESGRGIVLTLLTEVVERGATLPPAPEAVAGQRDDPVALLCYTSGSTGTPKGAVFTDRLLADLWRVRLPGCDGPSISVNFLPMSHIAGRYLVIRTLMLGGTAHFVARSDLSTMLEDIALVRPTEFIVVPRIWDTLFQWYRSALEASVDTGSSVERAVKADLKDRLLGGRVLSSCFTSAPMSDELVAFAESVLEVPAVNFYGLTEAGFVTFGGRIAENVYEHKLVDVPELGYFRTDFPYPRGELLVKSTIMISGYYQRPELTPQMFDEDGFYRTGDVMAEIAPGTFRYIDRRNNVLKLSQGEFVAVARLEALFVTSPAVQQIYVYGSSERAYLLTVVVPTPDAVKQAGGDLEAVRSAVRESLGELGRNADLNSYEIPRDVLIEMEPFTPENGLLSGARKLLRPKAKDHYGERLEELYRELARREEHEVDQLRSVGHDQPILDTVVRAARAVLGSTSSEFGADQRFVELGGDSLSALSFVTLLGEIFGVQVPVGVAISPASDLRSLAGYIERAREADVGRATFTSVHDAGSEQVKAADLTLDKFIDTPTLAHAAELVPPSGDVRTVLLTGANGYLGRFLCLEWLERLAPLGGKVVCIVRGTSTEAARARLAAAFDSGDAKLSRRFVELAADHLEVVAGDVGEPALGLDTSTWQRLADTVDAIVHVAALVNHVLPYDQLFGPNVAGTAEAIRLAITSKLKPITYTSTVAVLASGVSTPDEYSDIRDSSPVRMLDEGYANGYATSKWAGEVLLREAHDAYGLPIAVFRSDMIMAHSTYQGQLNVPDMFTRLLFSLLVTGIAPASFYRPGRPAHFDGLPVDFTARAVTTLAAAADDYHTYNLLNPHEDGISLDTYVDWLVEAGQSDHAARRLRRVVHSIRHRHPGTTRTAATVLDPPTVARFPRAGRPGAGSRVPHRPVPRRCHGDNGDPARHAGSDPQVHR